MFHGAKRHIAIRFLLVVVASLFLHPDFSQFRMWADGKVIPKRSYAGSLEEKSQEAIIIFQSADEVGDSSSAIEDLILSIEVVGNAREFAWILPFPNVPTVHEESPNLFKEIFDFVEDRRQFRFKSRKQATDGEAKSLGNAGVKVHTRQVVGEYEVAVVSEMQRGALNQWLSENEYSTLDNADDVMDFYRSRDYVFACVKYSSEALARDGKINSHPLRFRFATGGFDGMYFPMKLTGLQIEPFDVTIYVFCSSWLNDDLNRFGYVHRGFHLGHRDWDTPKCESDAGKFYSAPETDPYLKSAASKIPILKRLFQRLYPGGRFYLTKIISTGLLPAEVRTWSDDLWLFPYYTNRNFVPLDARPSGIAATAWRNTSAIVNPSMGKGSNGSNDGSIMKVLVAVVIFTALLILAPLGLRWLITREKPQPSESVDE